MNFKVFLSVLAAMFVLAIAPSAFAQNERVLNDIAHRRHDENGALLEMNPLWLGARANSCERWQMAATASARDASANANDCSAASQDALTANIGVAAICGPAMADLQSRADRCEHPPASPNRGPRLAQIPVCHRELGGATLLCITRDGRELHGSDECASVPRAQIRSATCECPNGGVATRFARGSRNVYCGMPYQRIVVAPPGVNNPSVERETNNFDERISTLETRINQICRHNVPAPTAPGAEAPAPAEPGAAPAPTVEVDDCADMMLRLWQAILANASGNPTNLTPLTNRVTELERRMTLAESNIGRLDRRINVHLILNGFAQTRFNGHTSFGGLGSVRVELGLVDRFRIYVDGGAGYSMFNGMGVPTTGLYSFSGGFRLLATDAFSLTFGFRHITYTENGTQPADEAAVGSFRGNYWGGEIGGRFAFTPNWALVFGVGFGQTNSVMVSAPTSVHGGMAVSMDSLSALFTLGLSWNPL